MSMQWQVEFIKTQFKPKRFQAKHVASNFNFFLNKFKAQVYPLEGLSDACDK
jgi:hypothetical protein